MLIWIKHLQDTKGGRMALELHLLYITGLPWLLSFPGKKCSYLQMGFILLSKGEGKNMLTALC